MTRLRATLVLIACLAGFGFTVVGIPGEVRRLESFRTFQVDDRWAGGSLRGIDIAFLDWVSQQLGENETFFLVDGEGDPALKQWSSYQLYPATRTRDPDTADWAIVYGTTIGKSGLDTEAFGDVRRYSASLHLVKRTEPRAGEGTANGS